MWDGWPLFQIAGSATMPIRSLMHALRCVTSWHVVRVSRSIADHFEFLSSLIRPPLAKVLQEFIGRQEEWVFVKSATDDHHGVRSKNVKNDRAAKFIEIVNANDRVWVPWQNIVQPGLVLY